MSTLCDDKNRTFELKTARGRMMSPLLHVCDGLARPADESVLARHFGTDIETTCHAPDCQEVT